MCGTRFGRLVSIFSFLFLLCSCFSFSEGKIYLTEEEFSQIQMALTLSETELQKSKKELEQAKTWLTEAQKLSMKALETQETLLLQFNEREKSWIEHENDLNKEIKSLNFMIKAVCISIGIGGIITIVVSAIGG